MMWIYNKNECAKINNKRMHSKNNQDKKYKSWHFKRYIWYVLFDFSCTMGILKFWYGVT